MHLTVTVFQVGCLKVLCSTLFYGCYEIKMFNATSVDCWVFGWCRPILGKAAANFSEVSWKSEVLPCFPYEEKLDS